MILVYFYEDGGIMVRAFSKALCFSNFSANAKASLESSLFRRLHAKWSSDCKALPIARKQCFETQENNSEHYKQMRLLSVTIAYNWPPKYQSLQKYEPSPNTRRSAEGGAKERILEHTFTRKGVFIV